MNPQTLLDVFGKRPGRLESLEALARGCGAQASSTVLEAGCGPGDGIAHLCRALGVRGVGLDLNAEVLQRADELHKDVPGLRFVRGSVYAIDEEPESFDLVVTEAAFSLLEDKAGAAAEYHRILRKGGRLLLRDFVSMEAVGVEDRKAIGHIPCFRGVGTLASYVSILETAGFDVERQEASTKELVATALYLSKAFGTKPAEISHLFARLMNGGDGAGESGQCFFSGNRLGFGILVAKK